MQEKFDNFFNYSIEAFAGRTKIRDVAHLCFIPYRWSRD